MRNSYKVLVLSAVSVLSQLSTIVLGFVLVRLYSKMEYGTYRQAFLIVDTAILFLSIPRGLIYFLPLLEKNLQKGLVLQTLALLGSFGLLGTLLVFGAADLLSLRLNNPELSALLPWFSTYILFSLSSQYVSAMLMGLNRYVTASSLQAAMALGRVTVTVAAACSGVRIGTLLAIVSGFSAFELLVVLVVTAREFKGIPVSWNVGLLKKQLAYSLPLALSGLVWVIGKEIDKYYLSIFFSPVIYSIFVVGALEIPIFRDVTNNIASVLIPKVAHSYAARDYAAIHELWWETNRKSLLVFLPGASILLVLATPLIGTLYTAAYLESVPVFAIYALLIPLRVFNANVILQGTGHTKFMMYNTVLFVIANLVLNFVSIKVFNLGMLGPAWATVASQIITTIIATIMGAAILKSNPLKIFPLVSFIKVILGVLVAAVATRYLMARVELLPYQLFLGGVTFATLYGGVTVLLGVYRADDFALAMKLIPRKRPSSA